MTTSYRDAQRPVVRAGRGTGSIRERSPGVWEIRVVVGFDAVHGRSVQRSFTVHGDTGFAQRRRRELVGDYGVRRVDFTVAGAGLTVGELMARYFEAPHLWKPATVVSHRPVVEALIADPLARGRLCSLTIGDVHTAIARWQAAGVTAPTVSARWLVLRGALSWAVGENLLRANPLAGCKGPPRPVPRRHHTVVEVRQLLACAETAVERLADQLAGDPDSARLRRLLYSAEQTLLLVRVAADSGARRGELAALRYRDLDGRVLTIERGLSHGVLGSTKTGRTRRLTLGGTTAALIAEHFASWERRCPTPASDWLFAPNPTRATYMTADALSHKFRKLGHTAGVDQPALHRLRHSVATHLVEQGHLLKAQARLGHRDPATTLRHYSHATPLDDQYIADQPQRTPRPPLTAPSSGTTSDQGRSR